MKRTVQKLADYLNKNNLTLALAESMTCGCAAHCIGSAGGTSGFFKGSIVCYDESVKMELFKVKPARLKRYTAESQQITDALAKNLKELIHADIYAAITGLAAPGGSESKSKPVGTVFFSVFTKGKIHKLKKKFNGSPLVIREKACDELFKFIIHIVKKA